MSNKEFVARNGLIANASLVISEGSNTYFTANSTQTKVGNVFITNNSISIGNSTVNAVINSSSISVGGGLSATNFVVGNVSIGQNLLTVGNSTVNVVINSTSITVANAVVAPNQFQVGNSTVNAVLNSVSLVIGPTVVNTSQLLLGNSTVNSVHTATSLSIGNTVVNTSMLVVPAVNTSALTVANATANTIISPGSIAINGAQLLPATIDIGAIIGDGTNVIPLGANGRFIGPFDFAGTIQQWSLIGQESGSISIDLWKCTYSQFDAGATHPVAADKISATAPITMTTATKNQSSTLTGWTTNFSAGDMFAFNVASVTSSKQVQVLLKVLKTT